MKKDLIKAAQEGLELRDVFQRMATARLTGAYDPKFDSDSALKMEIKHFVRRTEVLVPQEGVELPQLFRVTVDLGVRWGHSPDQSESPAVESVADDASLPEMHGMLGLIETEYVAEYEIKHEIEQAALDEFALHNPSYHVWPFFREFVASQCLRMNVPKLVMPMIQLAQNRDQPLSEI